MPAFRGDLGIRNGKIAARQALRAGEALSLELHQGVSMKDGLRFIDSDMHVMEPPDLFDRYLDPRFKDRVSVKVGADGKPNRGSVGTILIDGELTSDADMQQYRKPRSSGKGTVLPPMSASRLHETNRLDFAIERDYSPEAQVM